MTKPCPYCGDDRCLVHCVFCLTDCSIDEPEHGPACPSVTGRYPLPDPRRPTELDDPGRCTRCEAEFTDAYYLVHVDGSLNPLGIEDAPVYECVCFECKIAAETSTQ